MIARIICVSFVLLSSVAHAAEPNGAQLAEALANAAQAHIGIRDSKRSSKETPEGLTEVRYEHPSGSRFITYNVAKDGRLREFVVNRLSSEPYAPIGGRRDLIEKMIGVAAPNSSGDERTWAAKQLDGPWTRRLRPFPVQVGEFVFMGMTVGGSGGTHDTLWVESTSTGRTGLQFSFQPMCSGCTNLHYWPFITGPQPQSSETHRPLGE